MKRFIYSLLASLLITGMAYGQQEKLLFTYTINYQVEMLNVVILYANNNITVDWGNGDKEVISPSFDQRIELSHPFLSDGTYKISVFGNPDAVQKVELADHTDIVSIILGNGIEELAFGYGLSQLDVSFATELKSLDCWKSTFSSLNLSNNPKLTYINLKENPIGKDKVALLDMVESLPDRTGKEPGILEVEIGNFPRHRAICSRKNWILR